MHDPATRRGHALRIAVSLGEELGLRCDQPRIIKDSNNTIVHLAPAPVVAKVGTTMLRPNATSLLARELRVGQFLAARRAPIAPPTSNPPPGPYMRSGSVTTLWAFKKHASGRDVSDRHLAHALRALHAAFEGYPEPLPHFLEDVSRAKDALSEVSRTPQLSDSDRRFLIDVGNRITEELENESIPSYPLHGDPHLDGNVLLSDEGPLFVDFEAACIGPYEWDLTALERARSGYPEVRGDLLSVLSKMRSLCVATWCWMQYGRSPEVTEAAHVHLRFLRENASV